MYVPVKFWRNLLCQGAVFLALVALAQGHHWWALGLFGSSLFLIIEVAVVRRKEMRR